MRSLSRKDRLIRRYIWDGRSIFRASLVGELQALIERHRWLEGASTVLELGYERASHEDAYPPSWKLLHCNYRSMHDIDCVFDADRRFPFIDQAVDGTVLFNTLAMIEDFMNTLRESLRVSKRFVIFNVPLISALTPHPGDFNRFTASRIDRIIDGLAADFAVRSRDVTPIGGSFSSALVAVAPYLKWWAVRVPVNLLALVLDRLDRRIGRQCPMQYLVLLEKVPSLTAG